MCAGAWWRVALCRSTVPGPGDATKGIETVQIQSVAVPDSISRKAWVVGRKGQVVWYYNMVTKDCTTQRPAQLDSL